MSVAAFTKQIQNPVNLVVANDATGTQRYFRTGDKATVYGIELEYRKHLLFDEEENGKFFETSPMTDPASKPRSGNKKKKKK